MASDNTDARRERVRQLFGKSDRRIVELLIEEGFFGAEPKTADKRITFFDSARRQVSRDRQHWREAWKSEKREPRDSDSVDEYLARIETRIEDLDAMLDDVKLKGTPRVQALGELRQLEQARAKALGIESVGRERSDNPGDDAPAPRVLVLDLSNCSPEVKIRLTGGDDGSRGTPSAGT